MRKYTPTQEGQFKVAILDALNSNEEAITIDQIKKSNPMVLANVSTQKMAHLLNYMDEMGLVKKTKSKSLKRMVYKSVSKMLEQGYAVY